MITIARSRELFAQYLEEKPMRAVVQRVSQCEVNVAGEVVGRIGAGMLVLLGVEHGDLPADVMYLVDKVSGLRIFADEEGKMNRSVLDCGGGVLVVSQFTLCGDCRKGRRPAFTDAAEPRLANELYEAFCQGIAQRGIAVQTGVFAANMQVQLINDGPVTLLLDSRKTF
jgi:D-aminoacyl-tRNA deacylase